jgi:hypothetical protein
MNVTTWISGNDFDSKIEIPDARRAINCKIILTLNIQLVQHRGATFTRRARRANGTGGFRTEVQTYRTQNWTAGEWNVFRYLLTHIAQHWWSTQFWLKPPASFNEMNLPLAGPTHRPNFQCVLKINLINSRVNRHARVKAVRLQDDERDMRSHSRLFDNRDLQVSNPRDVPHTTAVHEIGHLLGLDHPGIRNAVPACLVDGNQQQCYQPHGEMMGSGLGIVDAYAAPWLDRIARHTHTRRAGWTVLRRDTPPTRLSAERLLRDITNGANQRMRDRLIRSADQL